MKYSKDELEILDVIEKNRVEKAGFDNDKLKNIASETLDYLNEKKQININIKKIDLKL